MGDKFCDVPRVNRVFLGFKINAWSYCGNFPLSTQSCLTMRGTMQLGHLADLLYNEHWLATSSLHRPTPTCPKGQTFDSRQVNAGVFVDANPVADDSERALLERTRAGHQLKRERDKMERNLREGSGWINMVTFKTLQLNPFYTHP